MNIVINEQQLQVEMNKIKEEFTDTRDIYREACALLFFRYGITPTANKLYQYIRRGSMSAPAEALNKFWLELREKSRVRIERPDLPENIAVMAGELISKLWNESQNAAQENLAALVKEASDQVLQFERAAEAAETHKVNLEALLKETQLKLEKAVKRASETDYLLLANTNTLNEQENALNALKIERDDLSASVSHIKASFSKDLNDLGNTLKKAEDRYKGLEQKHLIELDRARQQVKDQTKEISALRNVNSKMQSDHVKALSKLQNIIASLNQRTGNLTGVVAELKKQLNANKISMAKQKIK